MNNPPPDTYRLFIAFELPTVAKQRLARILAKLKDACAAENIPPRAIKWVGAESIHLTTQFLGDIQRSRIDEITQAVTDIYNQSEKRAFTLQSKIIGAFPSLSRPRVIWTDLLGADLARMKQIARAITERLIEIECPCDTKPFKPHLTLGRLRRDAKVLSLRTVVEATRFEPLEIVFQTLTLFRSELAPQGAIHTELQSWDFTVT